jgi:sterol desaturase/sphingolipid hydroxylase (fatty acid hydroxylase superfamily)
VLAGIFVFELASVGWRESSLRAIGTNWRSARNDVLGHLLGRFGFSSLLGSALLLTLPYVLVKYARAHMGVLPVLPIANAVLVIVIFYVVSDFFYYWFHRFCHTVPVLWSFHRYHHSASSMTLFSGDRVHPLEAALFPLWQFLPMLLLPVPVEYLMSTQVLFSIQGYLKHSNIKSDWGLLGRYVLISPGSHWIHHSVNEKHHNTNFADQFMFWDILFGTACYDPPEKIGLLDDSGTKPPLRYIVDVYVDFLRIGGRGIMRLVERVRVVPQRFRGLDDRERPAAPKSD